MSEELDIELSRKPTIEGNETFIYNQRLRQQKYIGPSNLKLNVPRKLDKKLGRNKEPDNVILAKTRFKVEYFKKQVEDEASMIDPSQSVTVIKRGGESSMEYSKDDMEDMSLDCTSSLTPRQKLNTAPKT